MSNTVEPVKRLVELHRKPEFFNQRGIVWKGDCWLFTSFSSFLLVHANQQINKPMQAQNLGRKIWVLSKSIFKIHCSPQMLSFHLTTMEKIFCINDPILQRNFSLVDPRYIDFGQSTLVMWLFNPLWLVNLSIASAYLGLVWPISEDATRLIWLLKISIA